MLYDYFIAPFVDMASAPDFLMQVLWEGLVSGILYALIALGFVLIFRSSRIFNFAQGIMVVFAALTLVGLHAMGVPAWIAVALTLAVMFVLAVSIERVVLRPLVNQPGKAPKEMSRKEEIWRDGRVVTIAGGKLTGSKRSYPHK